MLRAYASGRMFGVRHGEGPEAVLALHGWRRTHADFAGVLEGGFAGPGGPLAGVALDLPGFGASPPPETAWGSPGYAAALEPVLGELAAPVVLVGHSFGGRVAVHLAGRCPEAVRGVVLTGVPLVRLGPAPRPAAGYRAVRALARAGLVPGRLLEAARHRYGSADYRAAEGVMREVLVTLLQERYEASLAALACPVLIVVGSEDAVAGPAVAEAAARIVPRAEVRVLAGVGHLAPSEAPGALRSAVEDLLS